jgi:hypothetical protein
VLPLIPLPRLCLWLSYLRLWRLLLLRLRLLLLSLLRLRARLLWLHLPLWLCLHHQRVPQCVLALERGAHCAAGGLLPAALWAGVWQAAGAALAQARILLLNPPVHLLRRNATGMRAAIVHLPET